MEGIKNKSWEQLAQQYDWVADMEAVPQSPEHHAEGNVAIHTRMVLAELERLPEYRALPSEAQDVLWMAALLHDVEKRSTTFTEPDGSIVAPGHAKKGALTARRILYTQFDLPFGVREAIVQLVRYHGLPIWLMHKPDPRKTLLEASLQVNTLWLALLATADMLGRICEDKDEMLERIGFFEAYAREQHCWGHPYPFSNGLNRFLYFQKEGSDPGYMPYDETTCEVVLLSGLPGMGKDHYIREHFGDWPVVSLDGIRRQHKLKPGDKSANGWVAQQAKEQARVYLRSRRSFVWNATNITAAMRRQLIDLFTTYKAKVRLVYVERPYKVWLQQNAGREEAVPAAVLHKMLHKLEVPMRSEAHTVEYIT